MQVKSLRWLHSTLRVTEVAGRISRSSASKGSGEQVRRIVSSEVEGVFHGSFTARENRKFYGIALMKHCKLRSRNGEVSLPIKSVGIEVYSLLF